jgi:hypothetical protein
VHVVLAASLVMPSAFVLLSCKRPAKVLEMRCEGRGRVRAVYAYALMMRGAINKAVGVLLSFLSVSLFAEPLNVFGELLPSHKGKKEGRCYPAYLSWL